MAYLDSWILAIHSLGSGSLAKRAKEPTGGISRSEVEVVSPILTVLTPQMECPCSSSCAMAFYG